MKNKFLYLSFFLVIMILATPASVAAQEPTEDVVAPIFRPSPPAENATTAVTSSPAVSSPEVASYAVSPSQQGETDPPPAREPGDQDKISSNVSAQTVSVDDSLTPAALVAELVGPDVTVSNISYTGDADGSGSFSGGTGIVGFESGIILGSGKATSVAGPNDFDNVSDALVGPGDPNDGDPQLAALVPQGNTTDATVLEFDFECPGADEVEFRYVFSSEEYNEWVHTQFNDVFAFFLSHPPDPTVTNIALLPDGVTEVSVNTINIGRFNNPDGLPDDPSPTNAAFYRDNDRDFGGPFIDIEPDGLTVVLVAQATILPGVNHMKLAIADTYDQAGLLDDNYDSWVFLEAGSFQCNEPPGADAGGPYVGFEGSPIPLDGTGSSDPDGDPLSYSWVVDSALCSFDNPASATPNLTCADDSGGGIFNATLTVDDGEETDSDTAPVTVFNVAPTPDAGLDQTVFRNEAVNLSGVWTDPAESFDNPYSWTWDLDGDGATDSSGSAAYGTSVDETTSFALEGFYTLTFGVTDKDGGTGDDSLVVEVLNQPPDCSNTSPSVGALWPPNHKFVAIDVLGVTDPEGDSIVITIDSIFQDEVVNGKGDGNTTPDGKGVGTSTAKVRAERDGKGNGRVYHINFTADDGHGGSCSGELPVGVGVPHSQNPHEQIVDDGPLYDSTAP